MPKPISYYTDYSQELLEQYNQDRCEKFNKEQKELKQEAMLQRILAYCCVGFFFVITFFAIMRDWTQVIID